MDQKNEILNDEQLIQLGLEFFISRYGIEFSQEPSIRIGSLSFETLDQFLAGLDSVLPDEIRPPLDDNGLHSREMSFLTTTNFQESSNAADNKNSLSHGRRLLWYLGYIFSGNLEPELKKIERKQKQLFVRTPFSDAYFNRLLRALYTLHDNEKKPLVFKTFWPEDRPFAVCLTHDVDETKKTYQWLTRPFRLLRSGNFQALYLQACSLIEAIKGEEPYWTFDTLMQMEKKYQCVSSFYFLHETAQSTLIDRSTWRHLGRKYDFSDKAVVELINTLAREGFEIGLHGSYNSYMDLDLMQKEKVYLESFMQIPVKGCRQHNLNLSIPETWRIQNQTGLMYDATLGFNDCVGFRWGTCLPFHPYDQSLKKQLELLEIPLVIEDLPFFLEKDRKAAFLSFFSEVVRNNGVLTLLWHHNVINAFEYPGWGEAYEKMIGYARKKGAWITSGLNIAQWWIEREATHFNTVFSDNNLIITIPDSLFPVYLTIHHPDSLIYKTIENAEIIRLERNCLILRTPITSEKKKITISFQGAKNGY